MQARRKSTSGKKGIKKILERYGDQLACARYRYDEQRRKRFTTVEIIIEESGWSPLEKPEIVGLRVEFQEIEPQRRVKRPGGKWNSTKRVWEINYNQAVALGLKKRIVKLEVSDIRHHQVSNTRHPQVSSIGFRKYPRLQMMRPDRGFLESRGQTAAR